MMFAPTVFSHTLLILLLDGPRAQAEVLTRRQADRSQAA